MQSAIPISNFAVVLTLGLSLRQRIYTRKPVRTSTGHINISPIDKIKTKTKKPKTEPITDIHESMANQGN